MSLLSDPAAPAAGSSPARADLALAHGDHVLLLSRDLPLDLPSVAEAGAGAVAAQVRAVLAGHPDAVAGGVIPFDPAARPELFVCLRPQRRVELTEPHRPIEAAPPPIRTGRDPRYLAAVTEALARIAAGGLDKVVLARSIDLPLPAVTGPAGTPDDDAVLDALWTSLRARAGGHGFPFVARTATGVLIGTSPELVARVDDRGFASHPLAGSAGRDPDPARDAAARARLLDSDKDRREHGHVVDHIVARLGPLADRLDVPSGPSIHVTDSMVHLGTLLTGRLRPGVGALEAALAIHPTPAVCGTPVDRALQAVRDLEAGPRGAYAGLVGWTDARGHGCWALALRCAEITPGRARVFAGAGIVAGSLPDAEHAETSAKFGTVLAALGDLAHPHPAIHGSR